MAAAIGALLTAILACLIVKMHHRSEVNKAVKTFEEGNKVHKTDSAMYSGIEMLATAAN